MAGVSNKDTTQYATKVINDRECRIIPPKRGLWYFGHLMMIFVGPFWISGGYGWILGINSLVWAWLLNVPTYIPVHAIRYAGGCERIGGYADDNESEFGVCDDYGNNAASDDNWMNSSTDYDSSINTTSSDLFNDPVNEWFSGNIYHDDD